jgi:dihydropyrimidinase
MVLPGLIDPHVHLALPTRGTRSSDTPASGTAAALHGGVTTVIDFTIQPPGRSLGESLRAREAEFEGRAYADHAFHVNVTDFGSAGAAIAGGAGYHGLGAGGTRALRQELREVADHGGRSLKVFTCYSREGLRLPWDCLAPLVQEASALGLTVLVHAEDEDLLRPEAPRPSMARPAEAEAGAIRRVIEVTGGGPARIYFVHVSSAGGLRAIREGRATGRGDPNPAAPRELYAETCPQYLFLDDRAYGGPDGAQFTVTPPLRGSADRTALWAGLRSGEIDVVATDHCPFRRNQKEPLAAAGRRSGRSGAAREIPSGLPGIETRLPLLYNAGVRSGLIDWPDLIRLTSSAPAQIFGLTGKGSLEPGADADIVLFDPEEEWTLSAAGLHMNTDFSPYEGLPVRGKVRTVFLRGEIALDAGALRGEPRGRCLRRRP